MLCLTLTQLYRCPSSSSPPRSHAFDHPTPTSFSQLQLLSSSVTSNDGSDYTHRVPKVEEQFCSGFNCCGLELDDLVSCAVLLVLPSLSNHYRTLRPASSVREREVGEIRGDNGWGLVCLVRNPRRHVNADSLWFPLPFIRFTLNPLLHSCLSSLVASFLVSRVHQTSLMLCLVLRIILHLVAYFSIHPLHLSNHPTCLVRPPLFLSTLISCLV